MAWSFRYGGRAARTVVLRRTREIATITNDRKTVTVRLTPEAWEALRAFTEHHRVSLSGLMEAFGQDLRTTGLDKGRPLDRRRYGRLARMVDAAGIIDVNNRRR